MRNVFDRVVRKNICNGPILRNKYENIRMYRYQYWSLIVSIVRLTHSHGEFHSRHSLEPQEFFSLFESKRRYAYSGDKYIQINMRLTAELTFETNTHLPTERCSRRHHSMVHIVNNGTFFPSRLLSDVECCWQSSHLNVVKPTCACSFYAI